MLIKVYFNNNNVYIIIIIYMKDISNRFFNINNNVNILNYLLFRKDIKVISMDN